MTSNFRIRNQMLINSIWLFAYQMRLNRITSKGEKYGDWAHNAHCVGIQTTYTFKSVLE